jgi:hypothetical protein
MGWPFAEEDGVPWQVTFPGASLLQNQPRCPRNKRWIKKMWDTYTMKYCSAIMMNEVMSVTEK